MIHIDHLKKSYDSFTLECSLDIPKGIITGIIGMNGAVKVHYSKVFLVLILLMKVTYRYLINRILVSY